jgi:TRAP-type C4-dicarboxylate transport system permease small subunit
MKLINWCSKAANAIHAITTIMWWIAASLLLLLSLVSFIDVIGRYFLSNPLKGAQELVETGMCLFVYSGLSVFIWQRSGIHVPVVFDLLSKRGQLILRTCTDLLSFFILAVVAYEVFYITQGLLANLNKATTILKIPFAPFYLFAVIGCVLGCLEFIIHIITGLYRIVTFKNISREATNSGGVM